jgi:tetratricopeptide (TPR) repeat protein
VTTDRWARLEALFHAALPLGDAERETLLARECDDPGLRAEVARLLAAHRSDAGFIDVPAMKVSGIWEADEPAGLEGRRVGAYRIIREIARGGMGAVFLAERADGQYEQQVAVKVIKRGMDTDHVLARFRAERQILASLVHPNIARLLDGGTTEDGRPYFAMEYIEGHRIDVWCASHGLDPRRRLELFLQVCDAVSYAHQHLVIHRDIKPLNILVTEAGMPKLLDFGIAKVVSPDDDDVTSTVTGLRLLTPDYASPEQVEGRHATTASDVYSLGVVLYELLTGESPYGLGSRSVPEIVTAVCTTEPQRPSAVAHDPAARRALRGDLDTIVLTALQKAPERRYRSAEALAADIRRFVRGHPVLARPDSFRYRAGKFVRRNRGAVVSAALVVLALAAGIAATVWQAAEAREQARAAHAAQARAERRFNDVRRLANAVLFDYHDAISDLPGATAVRERLVRDALSYLDTLAVDAVGDVSLQRELAAAYMRVGRVQGELAAASMGNTEAALASYRKGVAILEHALLTDPADAATRRALAESATDLGALVWRTGDLAGGLALVQRARAMLEPLSAAQPADTALSLELNRVYGQLGSLLLETGDLTEALAAKQRAADLLDSAVARDPRGMTLRRDLSAALQGVGDVQTQLHGAAAALPAFRRSREISEALAAEYPGNVDLQRMLSVALYWEGETLALMDRSAEALRLFERSVGISEALVAADTALSRGDLDFGYLRIGDMLARLGREGEALVRYRGTLESRRRVWAADRENLWTRLALLESATRVCRTLAAHDPSAAPPVCSEARELIDGTKVDTTSAADLGYMGGAFGDLGDAYERLAGAPRASVPDRARARSAAHAMHTRSYRIWEDLARRGVISPVDTPRVSLAKAAVERTTVR